MFNPIEPYWARLPYILTGIDTVKQVGDLVKDLNCINVLVVTDKGVVKAGLLDNVQQSLEKSGIRFGIFDKCEPDAPIGAIMNCAQLAREGNYDLLIGLGGGSSLDTAKLTARVATEENISPDVIGRYISGSTSTNKLRNIMIATTAGS
ncbi:MAG: iron-containing alcohol dehydrogenase, partial [Dehalococcoidia bacterium]